LYNGILYIVNKTSYSFKFDECLWEEQEQVIGTYVCSQKHNYIPYITFTITTIQLHVSAINVGHLQVVHEAPYDKLYNLKMANIDGRNM